MSIGYGDDYTTGCLLDYAYFKDNYRLINASFQGVKRLFILAYFIAAGDNADQEAGIKDNRKYFLPRGEIKDYNVLIDGRHFHDQPINDIIKSEKCQ